MPKLKYGNDLKPMPTAAKPAPANVDKNAMFEILLDTVDEDDDGFSYNSFLNYLKKNNIQQEKAGGGGGGWPQMKYIAPRNVLEKMIQKYFDIGIASTPEEWRQEFDNPEGEYRFMPHKPKGVK